MNNKAEVIIVGAGLAGLSCAKYLKDNSIPFVILETTGHVGGRILTDHFEGYCLDHGFQVLLTAYPEAQNILNYKSLELSSFQPGAMVRCGEKFYRMADPFRAPGSIFDTLSAPIGNFRDKVNIAKLKLELSCKPVNEILAGQNLPTAKYLQNKGFSSEIIQNFFKPFFGGIFLERELATSSQLFNFFFKMFSMGDTAVPRYGMQEIPKQIAEQIGYDKISFFNKVMGIEANTVSISSGEKISAPHIVLAIDAPSISELIYENSDPLLCKSTVCFYYGADDPPFLEPLLVLNGNGDGPINNLSVISNVCSDYAPSNKSLISVSVIGNPLVSNDILERLVFEQLKSWFGRQVEHWKYLRSYRIKNALPTFTAETSFLDIQTELRSGLYVCGDYMSTGSINGAIQSGRLVAENIKEKIFGKVAGAA